MFNSDEFDGLGEYMERLTVRRKDGGAYYKHCNKTACNSNCFECDFELQVLEKLAKYEDLEEQGLLVKLPIKPGDTFWELCREHMIPAIYPRKAHTFSHCFYCMDHLGDFTFVTEDAAKEVLEKEEVDKDVRRV